MTALVLRVSVVLLIHHIEPNWLSRNDCAPLAVTPLRRWRSPVCGTNKRVAVARSVACVKPARLRPWFSVPRAHLHVVELALGGVLLSSNGGDSPASDWRRLWAKVALSSRSSWRQPARRCSVPAMRRRSFLTRRSSLPRRRRHRVWRRRGSVRSIGVSPPVGGELGGGLRERERNSAIWFELRSARVHKQSVS